MPKTTILKLRKLKKEKKKAVLITAYDYPQAILADAAGIDCILVGDSGGMTTLGYETTLPVTMAEMLQFTKAVVRGNKNAMLIGDLPYMTYQTSIEDAIRNSGLYMSAGCDMVKIENGSPEIIKAVTQAGILVQNHFGLTPQSRAVLGGYRVQSKTKKDYDILLEKCLRTQDAGTAVLLLETVPHEVGASIAESLEIPVYGIGAGSGVDGQLVILHDLIGLFFKFKSKFIKRYCEAGQIIQNAIEQYITEVRDNKFPTQENFYKIDDSELEELLGNPAWKQIPIVDDCKSSEERKPSSPGC